MDQTESENQSFYPRVRSIEAPHIADLMRIAAATNLSPWSAQGYIDEIRNPDSIMFRLESDANSTIGFIVGRTVSGGLVGTITDAEIYNIAVTEIEQNRGYGQLLFDSFAEICKHRRVGSIWLEVRESNKKAIRFYERNGFMRIQTRDHFYDDPREHAILMRLEIKH